MVENERKRYRFTHFEVIFQSSKIKLVSKDQWSFSDTNVHSWENDDRAISKIRLIYIMGINFGNANPVDSNVTCK